MTQTTNPPDGSAPTWWNFSGNVEHLPPTDGEDYYYTPTNLAALQQVLTLAQQNKLTVRVSGQRHSQPPLVTDDNRADPPPTPDCFLVDMSCYIDIPPNGIKLGPGPNQITVNPGVREDDVDAFLTAKNLMFQTVTAGGFFSIGGMTAVDVHGATVEVGIFAETATSFTIVGPNGQPQTIDASSAPVGGWSPLQFARVSLGGLGIVTQITLNVQPRPYANTLQGGTQRYLWKDQSSFVTGMLDLLTGSSKHDRLEVFFTPYAAPWKVDNFLVLWWDIVNPNPPTIPNSPTDPPTACALAEEGKYGAGKIPPLIVPSTQYMSWYVPAASAAAIALDVIEGQADEANKNYSELWLSTASQVMFMSYFIELPNLDAAGLAQVWTGLDAVTQIVLQSGNFHIAAPMEFRFIKAGNSAMSGTYSTNPDAYFVNLDLIGFVDPVPSSQYPAQLLQFFADIERVWVGMGGFPHNGKMYGFYDPTQPSGTYTAAFNPNFIAALRTRRGDRLQAYNAYRQSQDPGGLFYNQYLQLLMEG
jgi:FAD/FMN-containing dehydrogenase